MTPEEKQRIEQIRERRNALQLRHGDWPCQIVHNDKERVFQQYVLEDIDFLLSLVKEQEAPPQWRKGWPEVDGFYWSRETPNDMNILLVEIHRNRLTICGGNKQNVKEAFEGDDDEFLGPITPTATADAAATAMRSACVEKVRGLAAAHRAHAEKHKGHALGELQKVRAEECEIVATMLESLSIEKDSTTGDP